MLHAAIENRRGRATKAQQRRRIMVVYKMLKQSESRPSIVRYAAAAWNVRTRQIDTYMAGARAQLQTELEIDTAEQWALAIERLNLLFGMAFEARAYGAALKAQQAINQLCGLYPSDKARR